MGLGLLSVLPGSPPNVPKFLSHPLLRSQYFRQPPTSHATMSSHILSSTLNRQQTLERREKVDETCEEPFSLLAKLAKRAMDTILLRWLVIDWVSTK